MTAYLPVPVIQKAVWAQCENPNCGKWRKLPPGATIEENEPWYCFMNPDHERNTCSASEMEYDENVEVVIGGDAEDPEEAARNRRIMEQLEANIAAAAAARGRGYGRGRGLSRGRGRGRGRPPAGGKHGVPSIIGPAKALEGAFGLGLAPVPGRTKRTVSFVEDFDGDEDSEMAEAGRPGSRLTQRQVIKNLQRLLENHGQWEPLRGSVTPLPAALPPEALESLAHGSDESREVLREASDVCSSLRYFVGAESSESFKAASEDMGSMVRLATMLAAASGLVESQELMSKGEIESLGLDGIATLPEVNSVKFSVDGGENG